MTKTSDIRKTACTAMARITKLLLAFVLAAYTLMPALTAQAFAATTPEAWALFYQKYQSDWNGLQEDYEYCVEPTTIGAPLPRVEEEGDRVETDAEGKPSKYYFTLSANTHAEDNSRVLTFEGLDAFQSYERLEYRVYLSSDPKENYTYHRYNANNEEHPDPEYPFMEGNTTARKDTVREATEYVIYLWPRYSFMNARDNVMVTIVPGNAPDTSERYKIDDPGWMVRYTGSAPEYTVNFDGNNPTTTDAGSVEGSMPAQTWAVGEMRELPKNQFSRSGYTFAGWNTKPDGSGATVEDGGSYTMPTGGATLYAQWQRVSTERTVRYYPNDPNINDDIDVRGTMPDSRWNVGSSQRLRDGAFSYPGYRFAGWNTKPNGSGDSYADGQEVEMPEGGLVLYAQWEKIDDGSGGDSEKTDSGKRTVRYYPNDPDVNDDIEVAGATEDSRWKVGTTKALRKNGYSHKGYRFVGWNTEPDGSGTAYADGQEVEMPEDGLTLYAQWEKADEKTLTDLGGTVKHTISGKGGKGGKDPLSALMPKTGDDVNRLVMLAAGVVAFASIGLLLLAKRRKRDDEGGQR